MYKHFICATLAASLLLTACSGNDAKPDTTDPAQPTAITAPIGEQTNATLETAEDGTPTLKLVQRPCRFVQAEPTANFDEKQTFDACRDHNKATLSTRKHKVIKVPAGKLRIQVSSENVPYELGFWIRSVDSPQKAIAQGGGITPETPRSYEVDLKPGRYLYACPLNPTPDYVLIVE